MSTRFSFLLLLIVLTFLHFHSLPTPTLALSPIVPYNNASLISLSSPRTRTTHRILQDVLEAISVSQKWDPDHVRVTKLDARSARFGTAQRYEFRVRFGRSPLFFRFSDQVDSWKKLRHGRSDLGYLVDRVGSLAELDAFKVEGPFELQVGGDDRLSLSLPLSTPVSGLKRILVGEGITVEIRRAREVSLFHASDFSIAVNTSHVTSEERSKFWPYWNPQCLPLLPIQILGPASVVAYQTRNIDAYVASKSSSKETIELLPEKCYTSPTYKKQVCPVNSLSLKIAVVKRILRSLGSAIHHDKVSGPLKAKMKASTVINFQVELERDIKRNGTLEGMLANWRTKPSVERSMFEVVARVEGERLKPVRIKNVRPVVIADSTAWSNIMSNISFTKFPPMLLPPEALTLDVKW